LSWTREFTANQKTELVLASCRAHKTMAELCREHEIAGSLLRKWREPFLAADAERFLGIACDDRSMSRRDMAHLLGALWKLSSGDPAVGVGVASIDEAIGRGHDDMRTPLHLQSLSDQGLVVRLPNGTWALTPQGIAWLAEDRELSDR
jgi:Transposase